MKIFCSISTAGRSLLPAALFGAVLISLAAAVLVFQMRREKWLQALNTTAFLLLFVLLNVVFSKIDRQGDTHGSIDLLTGLLWIIVCTAAVTGMLEILLLRKQTGKTIGRNSVKQAIDSLPSAICWFTEEGTVKLCNLQMYRLFRMLAGRDLQMYAEICTALEDCPEGNTNSRQIGVIRLSGERQTYLFPDGSVWKYSRKEIAASDGRRYIEAMFSNVTGLYEKNLELRRQTEQLKLISRELKKLSEHVLELTRESEILAAKTRLHDRIGAGLIAIRQTLLGTQTAEEGAKALQAFRNAVRMIKSDNESVSEKGELAELMQDAEAIGMRIELFGELPEDTDLRKVFLIAIRECLTNGVRHADATLIHAEIVRKNKSILLYITNNGKPPEGVVVPKGGLLNLLRYVADCGGKMKKILIVEDQRMPRENMERMIAESGRYESAGSISDAGLALARCCRIPVDLILMDVCTAGNRDGIEAAAEIKAKFPNIKIIIVTSMAEVGFLDRAKAAGADSFWYKDISREKLIDIIDRTMAGEKIFPDATPTVRLGLADSTELTAREINVLRLVCDGLEYGEVAEQLNISERTVKYHVSNILSKTGYANKTRLAIAVTNKKFIIPRIPEDSSDLQ